MEEKKTSTESVEQGLQLTENLKNLFRVSRILGMEGQREEDPIARGILETDVENLKKIEQYLKEQNIKHLAPLKEGYGVSSVVLDAGGVVVRLSRMRPTQKVDIPHVLQPLAEAVIGGVSVQISKKLKTSGITEHDVKKVQDDLQKIGYTWGDPGTDNLGRDEQGNMFILDGDVKKL